ncbi:hypothetical protein [Microtetraspora sp. NBRC 16547]|uniref:hypothetical protein n=1 Tax=Microtetraspora sp. NBRC 16547 TaxID=3030993 RepID=UPI0024A2DB4E|nr:hypothetical protein [Microtetraspora sp. NBRC 16547]GLX00470.1 hypothetical protein Misp02_45560 [Microtetraspora sp. NBRC 16547]
MGGLALLLVAGCAAGGSDDVAARKAFEDGPLKFAKCMRENGIDMKDPVLGEPVKLGPENAKKEDQPKINAAMEKCGKLTGFTESGKQLTPDELDKVRALVRCLREKTGLRIGDPDETGKYEVTGLTSDGKKLPDDEFRTKVEAAGRVCDSGGAKANNS